MDQEDQKEQKDQEPELKKHKAKPKRHEYIGAILASIICIIIPFILYHLNRESEEDVIIPGQSGQSYNQGEDVQSNYSCPFWHLIGDNYCDDEANTLECGYDFNDCCKSESDRSLCTECLCYIPEDRKVVLDEQFKMECEITVDVLPCVNNTGVF